MLYIHNNTVYNLLNYEKERKQINHEGIRSVTLFVTNSHVETGNTLMCGWKFQPDNCLNGCSTEEICLQESIEDVEEVFSRYW